MRSQAISANTLIKLIVSMLVIFIAACGDSKSFKTPKPPVDVTPPKVEDAFPDETASETFEVDFKVEIVFSELMNIESLRADDEDLSGLRLFSGKKEQDAELEIEPRPSSVEFSVIPITGTDIVTGKEIEIPATKVELTHESGRFALNSAYTVVIGSPARDLVEDDLETEEDERNFFEGESILDFTTEQGEWKVPDFVPNVIVQNPDTPTESPLVQDAKQYTPKIISNAVGDTAVIWRQQLSPGINQLWVSRYLPNEESWHLLDKSRDVCDLTDCANAELVSTISTTNVIEFNAAINDLGHIAIVWSQASEPGELVSIWARLFDGNAWLNTNNISGSGLNLTGNVDSPQVAIDGKGNVVSIWREHNNAYSRIKTNIYSLGAAETLASGDWSEPPSFIDNIAEVSSQDPKLAMSSSGFAVAVWAQKTSNRFRIISNHLRLIQSEDWVGAELIDSIPTTNPEFNIGNASLPDIAIDQNNDAIAIWLKHDGQRNNLWYNRFTGSWGAVANYIERERQGDADYPRIVFSKSNRALATWTQQDQAEDSKNLMSSFFSAVENGWQANQSIAIGTSLDYPAPYFDREGNAVIMWQEGLTSGDVKASYYSKLSGKWSNQEILDSNGNQVVVAPLFEDGRFLAVWEELNLNEARIKSVIFSD